VIKYFKTFARDEAEEGEMDMSIQEKPEEKTSLDKVAELQENVFRKVETLEKAKLNMDNLSVPFVDAMSKEIEFELTNSQNEWRQQLTGIMEVLTHITDAFTDVKKGIDKVQSNHAELAAALMGEEESESASETETSSSSEEEDDETVTTRSKPSKGMMPMRSKR
jgi:uncharacterized damage-inducible protein DinB